jgi:hypothetical protein
MRDMRFESPINAKQAFYCMASKAKQRDVYAKARFDREPYHLTEMRKRKEIENERTGTH